MSASDFTPNSRDFMHYLILLGCRRDGLTPEEAEKQTLALISNFESDPESVVEFDKFFQEAVENTPHLFISLPSENTRIQRIFDFATEQALENLNPSTEAPFQPQFGRLCSDAIQIASKISKQFCSSCYALQDVKEIHPRSFQFSLFESLENKRFFCSDECLDTFLRFAPPPFCRPKTSSNL